MSDIVNHLESHLGPIAQGWKPVGSEAGIQAVRFGNQPSPGIDTFTTLGLSRSPLAMPNGRTVRQELLVSVYQNYSRQDIAAFLTSFAEYILQQQRALLRGDVVGPSNPLINGVRALAVYSSIPVFFEGGLATFQGTIPPTVIVWLLPLVGDEPHFIRQEGYERFEEELEKRQDVDFWSLDRSPVV